MSVMGVGQGAGVCGGGRGRVLVCAMGVVGEGQGAGVCVGGGGM